MTIAQSKHIEVQILDLGKKPFKEVWNYQKKNAIETNES